MLTVAKAFELENSFGCTVAKIEHNRAEIKASCFLIEASVAIYKWYTRMVKTMRQCHAALKLVQGELLDVFEDPHFDDSTVVTISEYVIVFSLCAAKRYLLNQDNLEEDIPVHALYKESASDVSALQALFSEIWSINWPFFASFWFDWFLHYKITQS